MDRSVASLYLRTVMNNLFLRSAAILLHAAANFLLVTWLISVDISSRWLYFIGFMAEAERKIAEARGDSAKAVIEAAGRAEAIKKEQLSLTALYIEYIKIQKWNGEVPSTVAGQNSGFLIQPGGK